MDILDTVDIDGTGDIVAFVDILDPFFSFFDVVNVDQWVLPFV